MASLDRAFAPLEETIDKSPDTTPEAKKQFAEKVKEAKEQLRPALITDKWIYRWVVVFLGLAILGSLFATWHLTTEKVDSLPDIFLAIGSAAVGALAGLLAPSPGRGGDG